MATYNDPYPVMPGPLVHTPTLFSRLNLLTVYDIYKLQLGALVYKSINNIDPTHSIILFTRTSEIHHHFTRHAEHGNMFSHFTRTSNYGLKGLTIEGTKLWNNITDNIKEKTSLKNFKTYFKKHMIDSYN